MSRGRILGVTGGISLNKARIHAAAGAVPVLVNTARIHSGAGSVPTFAGAYVGGKPVARIYEGSRLIVTARASAPPVADPANLPYWGEPVWRDEFDYTNTNGDLDLDPTKWQKWDYNTLNQGTMPGTLGLLNDASVVKGSQVAVVPTPDGDTAVRIRSEWMDTPVITSSGPVAPQTYRHFKTGYIDQRNIDGVNRQRYGRWEAMLWIPVYPNVGLGMLWAFWFRNGSSGEWDLMESWGSGPSAAGQVTTGLYPRAAQPKPNAGTSTNTIHRSTTGGAGAAKVAQTHSHTPALAGRWTKCVTIWTPDLFEVSYDGVVKTSLHPGDAGATFPRTETEIANGESAKTLWTAPEMNSPWYMRMNVHPGPSGEYYGVPDNNNRQWTADSDFMCKYVRVWAMPE